MRFKSILCTILFLVAFYGSCLCVNSPSAITYVLNRGRFGDHLLNYSKAKWVEYQDDILFFYTPFKYSNMLKMHELENVYTKGVNRRFKRSFRLNKIKNFRIKKEASCLYISNCYALIDIDWSDSDFVKELKRTISPVIPIPKPHVPEGYISVAVHVRKGGGYDEPLMSDSDANKKGHRLGYFADEVYPLKFPPDSYYIESIKKLYGMLNKSPLYVYVYTDDKNPRRIVDKFKKQLTGLDITFSCRESGNHHDKNVIEDFFGMTYFDCLIRSGSHFSFFADVIGDYLVVIYPEHAFWKDGELIVDQVKAKIRENNFYKVLNVEDIEKVTF